MLITDTFSFPQGIKGRERGSDLPPSLDRYMIIGWFYVYKGQG